MQTGHANIIVKHQSRTQLAAIAALLVIIGLAIAGPSGFLAWSQNLRQLDQRQKELQQIKQERDMLRNRVALLDPNHPDTDLAGELLRRDLNVVHQDEKVMILN
ncbi:MAG: hypothetical protein RLZZ136_661 [Pseudomonadota bacterium]|jgi:cell division protein FtsB